jgi:transposase
MSREVGGDHHTAGQWRRRYLALGLSGLQDAVRSGRPKVIAAPTRVHVISVASTLPQDQERPVTRWTLEEIATTVCETLHTDPLSRSSIWRILEEADLKPHRSVYWLNQPRSRLRGQGT